MQWISKSCHNKSSCHCLTRLNAEKDFLAEICTEFDYSASSDMRLLFQFKEKKDIKRRDKMHAMIEKINDQSVSQSINQAINQPPSQSIKVRSRV